MIAGAAALVGVLATCRGESAIFAPRGLSTLNLWKANSQAGDGSRDGDTSLTSMAPSPSSPVTRRGRLARLGALLHRYFLPVLLAVYIFAGLLPGPGSYIREFAVRFPGGSQERVSMLLLAVLLFCAAAVIELEEIRELIAHPSTLLAGLLACWFGPVLLVVLTGSLLPSSAGGAPTEGLLVGLALVAAMPVANSSAGWTQNARGNVTLSLGLIVLSILLSPLATPSLLKLMGLALSATDTAHIQEVVTRFSGSRFILWVILPSLAGAAVAWRVGPQRISAAKPWFRIISLTCILVLNYANASLAVQNIWESGEIGVTAIAMLLACAVSLVGIVLAAIQTRATHLPWGTGLALMFSLSMKHTGLALVLAGEILKDEPRVILVILLTTLAQHVAAAAIDWHAGRRAGLAAS
jgi:bile acid:Na+ symporter, BASS family